MRRRGWRGRKKMSGVVSGRRHLVVRSIVGCCSWSWKMAVDVTQCDDEEERVRRLSG